MVFLALDCDRGRRCYFSVCFSQTFPREHKESRTFSACVCGGAFSQGLAAGLASFAPLARGERGRTAKGAKFREKKAEWLVLKLNQLKTRFPGSIPCPDQGAGGGV